MLLFVKKIARFGEACSQKWTWPTSASLRRSSPSYRCQRTASASDRGAGSRQGQTVKRHHRLSGKWRTAPPWCAADFARKAAVADFDDGGAGGDAAPRRHNLGAVPAAVDMN